jgi:hypothetical protein
MPENEAGHSHGNAAGIETTIRSFAEQLGQMPRDDGPATRAKRTLDNVASHDFAFYEFLIPTEEGYRPTYGDLSDKGLAYLDQLESQGVPPDQLEQLASFLEQLESLIEGAVYATVGPPDSDVWIRQLIDSLYDDNSRIIVELYAIYRGAGASGRDFLRDLYRDLSVELADKIRASTTFTWLEWHDNALGPFHYLPGVDLAGSHPLIHWKDRIWFATDLPQAYPFELFPRYSANVGLRLVYRQEWKPLKVQPGEIVRTIPLGPGQKERVTTKVLRRRKQSSTMETATEAETTTESTDTTKDSSEVVAEATDTFNWKVDAEFHAGVPIVGGSVNTSFGGSEEDKSKETTSSLSEAMRKAASKLRRETKVVVSTESEESFEQEYFSEITNPNNELPITYEYHKLQQQYEVFTYLAEVQSVVFVAEDVPSPVEIDEEWVRKYDWILAKVLKDESYRQTLNDLIQDTDENDPLTGNDPFRSMLDKALQQFATFNPNTGGLGGLTVPDIYAEPQRIYQERLRENAARQRANELRFVKRQRLLQHIRDNILYYCRAIWAHEDPDQRIQRYKKEDRRVPIAWRGPSTLAPLGARGFSALEFVPTGQDAPLWELIDPTGPIDYGGNYAVFGLRPLPESIQIDRDPRELASDSITVSLDTVHAMMRAPYVDPTEGDTLLDPALRAFRERAGEQRMLSDEQVEDLLTYLPRLESQLLETDSNGSVIVDAQGRPRVRRSNGLLQNPVSSRDWAEYLYRKNGTRRFLVDSNNLYLSIRIGQGAILETFKRAHRYIDVLKAYEELGAMGLKNERRGAHMGEGNAYDPDIEKILIMSDGANSMLAGLAALDEALRDHSGPTPEPGATPTVSHDGTEGSASGSSPRDDAGNNPA